MGSSASCMQHAGSDTDSAQGSAFIWQILSSQSSGISIKQISNETNLQFIFNNQLIGVKSINRSKYNKYFIIDIIYMLPFMEGMNTIMSEEHVYMGVTI